MAPVARPLALSAHPDLYSAAPLCRQVVYAKTGMTYGTQSIKLDWSGLFTIDGVAQTVSLYSTTTYKKVVLTAFLAPGTHTVKIARAVEWHPIRFSQLGVKSPGVLDR